MSKKWAKERNCDATKTEIHFETLLKENGFKTIGYKENSVSVDYLIEKDGVQCEYKVHSADNSIKRGDACYKSFLDVYNATKQVASLN